MLALLAGSGDLPKKIMTSCHENQQPLILFVFEGQTPDDVVSFCYPGQKCVKVKLGAIGEILSEFKIHHVTDVVMAGAMTRPHLKNISLDWVGIKWMKHLGMKAFRGDNDLLSGLVSLIEAEGYNVKSSSEILSLFVNMGALTTLSPSSEDFENIQKGKTLLNVLSPFDVGQSIVIQNEQVIGIEAIEGTEQLLTRIKPFVLKDSNGVLIKMKKLNQNEKVDLPTIGLKTIQQAYDSNLKGIAIEAQGVQVLDQQEVVDLANKLNLFIWAF